MDSEDLKIIEKLGGKPLEGSERTTYEKWSLSHFHNSERVTDPTISMTLRLDATLMKKKHSEIRHAGFNAYLYWALASAIKEIPNINYRELGGKWYKFPDVPTFTPIAIGGPQRYSRILIENPGSRSWKEFAEEYTFQMNRVQSGQNEDITVPEILFKISNVMGNLPAFDFTAFKFHQWTQPSGQQLFYFGKRLEENGKLTIPFHVTMDHANCEPFLFEKVFKRFIEIGAEGS